MNKIKIYKQNLTDAKLILDDLKIKFWLDSGTLLGAYREGGAIKGDEDDIDLVTHVQNKVYLKNIVVAFKDKGFKVKRLRDTIISMERNKNHVDVFFANYTEKYYYLTLYWQKKPFALVVPKNYWDNLGDIKFYGLWFQAPHPVVDYLIFAYGPNWNKPLYRPEFQNYNPEHEKRVDWDFLNTVTVSGYEKKMKKETEACLAQAQNSLDKEGLDKYYVDIRRATREYKCPICKRGEVKEFWHEIDSKIGQQHLKEINSV